MRIKPIIILIALVGIIGIGFALYDQGTEVPVAELETIVVENEPIAEAVEEPVEVEFDSEITEVESVEIEVVEETAVEVTEVASDESQAVEAEETSTEEGESPAPTSVDPPPVVESKPEAVVEVTEEQTEVEPVLEEVAEETEIEMVASEEVEVVEEEVPVNDTPVSVPDDGSIGGKSMAEIDAQASEELKAQAIGLIISKLSSDEISRFKGYLEGGISDAERADIMNVFHTKFTASEQEWVWSVYNSVVLGKSEG